MRADPGGLLWLTVTVGMVIILGGGIAYGMMMWRRRPRDPTVEQVRDDVTDHLYDLADNDEKRDSRR